MSVIQPGQNLWTMVRARNPAASNADVNRMVQQVMVDNKLNDASARLLLPGTRLNLGAAEPPPPPPPPPPRQPAPAPVVQQPVQQAPVFQLPQFVQQPQQPAQQQIPLAFDPFNPGANLNLNPFSGVDGIQAGLQGFNSGFGGPDLSGFINMPQGSLNNFGAAANNSGNFLFGLGGGRVLPFANPEIILGNLNFLG